MKAKSIAESLNEGIPWSGRNVTNVSVIGKVITREMDMGGFKFDRAEYDVVEIIEEPGKDKIYITNTWHKEHKRIPQLIPGMFVDKFIPINESLEMDNAGKWEIIFMDCGDNTVAVSEKFNSKAEAESWADSYEYDYQDLAYDEDGNEYWKTFYRYFNPEDRETYVSYEVQPVYN